VLVDFGKGALQGQADGGIESVARVAARRLRERGIACGQRGDDGARDERMTQMHDRNTSQTVAKTMPARASARARHARKLRQFDCQAGGARAQVALRASAVIAGTSGKA